MASTEDKCFVEYNHVGKSGLKVSNICLGTMTFGRVDNSPVAVSNNNNNTKYNTKSGLGFSCFYYFSSEF